MGSSAPNQIQIRRKAKKGESGEARQALAAKADQPGSERRGADTRGHPSSRWLKDDKAQIKQGVSRRFVAAGVLALSPLGFLFQVEMPVGYLHPRP